MNVVESFPRGVREIENCWIPMPDGCRLAARIWLPEDSGTRPVPAVLEYIPYRKRDRTRWRDEPMHRYFAGHGYAAVRVDLRGTGDSDGLLLDEYLERELDDGVEVIRWIAGQPWCSGTVGMIGKSWGGFNALQIAARRPEALRAIITVCSTDDRYADDAHYMGGCLLGENLLWGSVLMTLAAQPPDPAIVGERWRRMWTDRLESVRLFPGIWMSHPRRDDYWKHGSVCEDFAAIRCPVWAVGGWADGYTNAIPRLMAGLPGTRRGLIGPWAHVYPHQGVPGPPIGFLQEALAWWDRWLGGGPAAAPEEPPLRVWMQESARPDAGATCRDGRWVAETGWPPDRMSPRELHLNEGRLDALPARGAEMTIASPQSVGKAAGVWCSFGSELEMPGDQREDAAGSLLFESAPLTERIEILGEPEVRLRVIPDRRCALLAARLNDVAPDGVSERVTYGVLNLTHRSGHESPEPMVPGRPHDVRVRLNAAAHAFAPGHRIRLALSTSYWPLVWPSPEPVTLRIRGGEGVLMLPVRLPRPEDALLRPFPPPEAAPEPDSTELRACEPRRTVNRDAETGETIITVRRDADDSGRPALWRIDAIDLTIGHAVEQRYSIRDDDPLSARAEILHTTEKTRGNWSARVECEVRLTSTRTHFRLEANLVAREGERLVASRAWDEAIPRDFL